MTSIWPHSVNRAHRERGEGIRKFLASRVWGDRFLSFFRVRVAYGVASTHGVISATDGSGATHQTSIEGSAEVISRSRRLSEKTGEPTCTRVAQALQPSPLRDYSVGDRTQHSGDSDSPRNSFVPHDPVDSKRAGLRDEPYPVRQHSV